MATVVDWSTRSGASWPAGEAETDSVSADMNAGNVQANAAVAGRLSIQGNGAWGANGWASADISSYLALNKDFLQFPFKPTSSVGSTAILNLAVNQTLTVTPDPGFYFYAAGNILAAYGGTYPEIVGTGYTANEVYTMRVYRIIVSSISITLWTINGGEYTQETPLISNQFDFSGAVYLHFNINTANAAPNEVGNITSGNGGILAAAVAATSTSVIGWGNG